MKLISVEEGDRRQPSKEMNTNCTNMEKGDKKQKVHACIKLLRRLEDALEGVGHVYKFGSSFHKIKLDARGNIKEVM
jgi:hypothetical protein